MASSVLHEHGLAQPLPLLVSEKQRPCVEQNVSDVLSLADTKGETKRKKTYPGRRGRVQFAGEVRSDDSVTDNWIASERRRLLSSSDRMDIS